MKKLSLLYLAALCTFLLIACGIPEGETEKPYADTFALTKADLSAARAVQIRSGTTGRTVLLTDREDIDAIVSAALPLTGKDPVSSRGTYGWTYDFTFYETDAPGENDIPLLFFGLHIFGEKAYTTCGVYEKITRTKPCIRSISPPQRCLPPYATDISRKETATGLTGGCFLIPSPFF